MTTAANVLHKINNFFAIIIDSVGNVVYGTAKDNVTFACVSLSSQLDQARACNLLNSSVLVLNTLIIYSMLDT